MSAILMADFPRAARTSVLLAVMLIVFLSACGGSSAPETGNDTQQEAPELADDSADNDSAFATEEIPSEEFAVPECDDEALRTDRASLTALYNATDGPNWTDNTNWLTDAPLSEWAGVNSLSFTGSECVTLLLLSGNQLSGEIPAELGNLTTLKSLGLEFNQLSGEIPAELENLTTLKWLGLSLNQLSGEIPAELENLTTLEHLSLGDNQLSGCIPASLRHSSGDIGEMPYCDG